MSDGNPRFRGDERVHERAFVTVQFVAATGFSLILLVLVANLLVDVYARGVVRDAIDTGTRAAAPVDAPLSVCEQRSRALLESALPGALGASVRVQCGLVAGVVVARASVRLPSWLPGLLPDWVFTATAAAVRER